MYPRNGKFKSANSFDGNFTDKAARLKAGLSRNIQRSFNKEGFNINALYRIKEIEPLEKADAKPVNDFGQPKPACTVTNGNGDIKILIADNLANEMWVPEEYLEIMVEP